jgi:hypothetical protein
LNYYDYYNKIPTHYAINRRISMNKKITFVTIVFLVVSIFLVGSRKEQQELYLNAMNEKDPATKMQLLKEYLQKYGEKKDKFVKFAYLNLSNSAYNLKNYDEAIQYGEEALGYQDLDAANKLLISLSLANSYYATKRDMDKAYQYCQTVIDVSNNLIQQTKGATAEGEQADQTVSKYETFYLAPAYRLQGLILYFKDKDNPESIKQAAEKSVEAFNYGKTDTYYKMAFSLASNLAQKGKFDYAIHIAEKIIDQQKIKYNEADFLAKLYKKKKNKDKSLFYYELAYKTKPTASLAKKLGQMVHKQDAAKALKYFADAFVRGNMDKEDEVYKFLEHLYFNVIAKNKSEEEKEVGFKKVFSDAKARCGVQ